MTFTGKRSDRKSLWRFPQVPHEDIYFEHASLYISKYILFIYIYNIYIYNVYIYTLYIHIMYIYVLFIYIYIFGVSCLILEIPV